jgi:SAM-dependent methyltransferase
MSKKEQYKKHWSESNTGKDFIGFKQFIKKAEEDIVAQVGEHIISSLNKKKIDVLDVGPGEGSLSIQLVSQLSNSHEVSSYTGVEISDEMIKALESKKDKFAENAHKLNLIHGDAEEVSYSQSFDLITSLNSWYGLAPEAVKRLKQNLSGNGLLAILISSRESITVDLTEQFADSMFAAEDLKDWFNKSGVGYEEVKLTSDEFSKSQFLEKSEKRTSFFNYLLRDDYEVEQIEQYLESKPDEYFRLPHSLFMI